MTSSHASLSMTELVARFGRNPLDQPVFYNNPVALRFQLDPGGGSDHDPTWRWAVVDRIRAVARWAFADSEHIDVVTPRWVDQTFDEASAPDGAAGLARAGFAAPLQLIHREAPDDDTELATLWYAARSVDPLADVDRIVWQAFVEPRRKRRYNHLVYFVDLNRGLMLFPYDSRGMDLVATDPATLLDPYRRFDGWLLDYDRGAMAATMSGATGR